MAKATTATRTKGRTDIRYFHDGLSLSEGHRAKLSTLAYFYSFDLDTKSPARLGTKDFTAALAKAGVVDPGAPGWMVKLPNGVTVECRLENEKSQFSGTPAARKSASKAPAKATGAVKKAAGPSNPAGRARADARASKASKKAPAKNAAAKKGTSSARAKAQVTPIPKNAAAKRPTRAN